MLHGSGNTKSRARNLERLCEAIDTAAGLNGFCWAVLERSGTVMSEVSESGRAWIITWLLGVFMLINFLDKIVLGLVAVPMMDELGLTPKQFGDIGSGFFWLFALGGVLGGFLANHLKAGALI